MEEHNRTEPTDRISALPEHILHHILSFLPNIKHVKVTSALSKTWYHISNSCPYFDFVDSTCDSTFLERGRDIDKYRNCVTQTLNRFHHYDQLNLQTIQRLTIPIALFDITRDAPLLDSWISLALQHGVHELNVLITRDPAYEYWRRDERLFYDLPPPVFAAKSMIKVAKFEGCSLLHSFPNNCCVSGSCSNLVKLQLDKVRLDEFSLSSVVSACPLIEELYISILSSMGVNHLRVSNLNKLKTLRISQEVVDARLEIVEVDDMPSLQSLEIQGLVTIRVHECPKLTHLNLCDIRAKDLRVQDLLSSLPLLRSLSLENLHALTKVKISSNTLNELTVFDCYDLFQLEIDAPNLLSVHSYGWVVPSLASSMHNNVTCRWYAYTNYNGNAYRNPYTVEDFLVQFRRFVSTTKRFGYLKIDLKHIHTFSFEELLNKSGVQLQPVVENKLDHLVLHIRNADSQMDLFDAVLWICHPHTLSLPNESDNDVMVKYIREVLRNGNRCRPCKPARMWLYHLEDVRYVAKDGRRVPLPLDESEDGWLGNPYVGIDRIDLIFKW